MSFRLSQFGLLVVVGASLAGVVLGQLPDKKPATAAPQAPASGATALPALPSTPPPTRIVLLKGVNNSIQLGLQVDGQFAYPFVFTADTEIANGLTLSGGGLISGTPTNTDDLTRTITVKDNAGKTIKVIPIVLHVAASMTVMLESGATVLAGPAAAAKPDLQAKTASNSASTLIVDPVYAGGDTVRGVLKAAKPSQSDKPQKTTPAQATPTPAAKTTPAVAKQDPPAKPHTPPSQAADTAPPGTDGTTPPPAGDKSGAGDGGVQSKANADTTVTQDAGSTAQAGGDPVTIGCDKAADAPADNDPCKGKNVTIKTITDSNESFAYQFHRPFHEGDAIAVSSSSAEAAAVQVLPPPRLVGEQMRTIVGYQQAGASSSGFTQDWFLDFYISRPISFYYNHADDNDQDKKKVTDERDVNWRWWGNVRVASFPQPGNQTVAETVANVGAQVGALKLNQLAQGAEFLAGVEYQPWKSPSLRGLSENTRQVFRLGLIAAVGATGFFSPPSNNATVLAVPAAGSPQLATFQKEFPGITTANVAFLSPDVTRFPKEYLGGIRLTTHYIDPTGKPLPSAPAMVALSIGQNQVITSDHLRGVVGRVEAFYPLPFGNRGQTVAGAFSSIYLFGTAQMQLANSKTVPPLALAPVTGVLPSDPSVTLIPLPNTRDEYRIGAGVDLVGLFSSLTGGSSKNAAQQAPKTPSAQSGKSQTPSDNSNPPPN